MFQKVDRHANIYKFPQEFEAFQFLITLGDLHGNFIKLLYFLLRNNIIDFKKEVNNPAKLYEKIVNLYEESYQIIENPFIDSKIAPPEQLMSVKQQLLLSLEKFDKYCELIEIKRRDVKINLLGDEVADRGYNDFFTLKMLAFLTEHQVDFDIIFSNHASKFVKYYEKLFIKGSAKNLIDSNKQYQSSNFIKRLIDYKVLSIPELKCLIDFAYKPHLKMLSYSGEDDYIILYTHAPIKFSALSQLACYLNVKYEDKTIDALGRTIDKINTQFKTYVDENRVHQLIKCPLSINSAEMTEKEIMNFPVIYFTWNRWNKLMDSFSLRPVMIYDYFIYYVHGHDPYQSSLKHIINLDTLCGKFSPAAEKQKIEQLQNVVAQIADIQDENFKQLQALIDNVKNYRIMHAQSRLNPKQYSSFFITQEFKTEQKKAAAYHATKVKFICQSSAVFGLSIFSLALMTNTDFTILALLMMSMIVLFEASALHSFKNFKYETKFLKDDDIDIPNRNL